MIKHRVHVQSLNGAKSINQKNGRLFKMTGSTKDYINDIFIKN